MRRKIRIAHSPDSDDAFMFYALATGKIESDEFEFIHKLDDIETLNQAALEGKYEVTAISIHAYAYVYDRYALLSSGASMGDNYGPVLVSATRLSVEDLAQYQVGIPGRRTSAYLALKLYEPHVKHQVISFEKIIPAVQSGKVDAGLIIHEGQLTYRVEGLYKILDLGEWWTGVTGLPLPLGGNVIRRDLGPETTRRVAELIRESIRYALSHRDEAMAYALQFGRGLDAEQGDRFVSMYVNERTLDYGEDGRKAVQVLLDRGHAAGIIPHEVPLEFV